jgi:molybdopterin synthase catalytic subunit/molybdopterin converting factor small subunit
VKVTVRFFAHLRERVGRAELQVELEGEISVETLRSWIIGRHPELAGDLERYPVVVDGEIRPGGFALYEGAEVAWLPPVAGGAGGEVVSVFLTAEPLDSQALAAAVAHPGAGAIALFLGVVRDHEGERKVERLEYEAYEGLATKRLRAVAEECLAMWPEARIAVAHRVGPLDIGEASVVVAVATPHRAEAFDCCRTLMDRVKVAVPVWKKSIGPDGDKWVEGQSYDPGNGGGNSGES